MQRATSGAFSNPYEVRATLRAMYWEGRSAESLKKTDDGKANESEVESNLARAKALADALSEARAAPRIDDEVESPE